MEVAAITKGIINTAYQVVLWGSLSLIAGLIIWWYMRRKRYNHTVYIFEEDENGKITNINNPLVDKGGVYVDRKSNLKLFFLKKKKVGLIPDKIPVIKFGKMKSVFLIQRGLKNFSYARFPSGFVSNPSNVQMKVYDEDVSWAINDAARAKKAFGENWIMQMLPYISLIIVGVLILVMIIIVLQKFEILQDVSAKLVTVSENLVKANSGTTVVGG